MSRPSPPAFVALLSFTLGRLSWPLLLLPPVFLTALSLFVRWSGWMPDKRVAEYWALNLVYAAVAVALLRYWRRRDAYWLWLALLAATLLLREYHIDNTSVGAFVVLVALLLYAWQHYPRFAGYFASEMTVSLMAAMLLCYALALACDKGLLNFMSGSFLLQNRVEEYIENLGHIFLLLLTLCSRKQINPLINPPA
ncbi:MAG: hypothetical protein ACRETN_02435 [Nevskiales bacterium]